jgi:hypothetical protein
VIDKKAVYPQDRYIVRRGLCMGRAADFTGGDILALIERCEVAEAVAEAARRAVSDPPVEIARWVDGASSPREMGREGLAPSYGELLGMVANLRAAVVRARVLPAQVMARLARAEAERDRLAEELRRLRGVA